MVEVGDVVKVYRWDSRQEEECDLAMVTKKEYDEDGDIWYTFLYLSGPHKDSTFLLMADETDELEVL
jgi:hypothetical protein